MKDTAKRLVQHLIYAAFLSLRLYALPLLYISHQVALLEDAWELPSKYLPRLRRSASCRIIRLLGVSTQEWLQGEYRKMLARSLTPFHMVWNLYRLAIMLERDPNILERTRVIAALPLPIDEGVVYGAPQTILRIQSLTRSLNAPASASQVYHAALIDNETLDDLLATFSSHTSTPSNSRRMSSLGENIKTPEHRADFRNTSIQTTPEDKRRRQSGGGGTRTTVHADEDYQHSVSSGLTHVGGAYTELPHTPIGHEVVLDCTFQEHKDKQNGSSGAIGCFNLDDVELNKCPTYEKRHHQSRLPTRMRKEKSTQTQIATLKRALVESPIQGNTKQKKLRRRIQ